MHSCTLPALWISVWWQYTQLALQWRHNELDGVSNHQPRHCLLNRLFRRRSKKTKLRVTGLCEGNSPVTGEFPAQKFCNAENVSIWWRHHVIFSCHVCLQLPFKTDSTTQYNDIMTWKCPLCGESTASPWFPHTTGQCCGTLMFSLL